MLSVPKGFFEFPLNAPSQKIIGWEVFVQSQSEHFIHVQKKVSKTRWNMHKIKKIMSLCFVNFWWTLRKCSRFFILSLNKSCAAPFNWDSIFNISNSHSLADFSFSHLKKIHQNRFIRKGKIIPQLSILKQDLVILKMKKCLHYLKFHQKLIKQSDLIFFISCMFDLLLDTCFWTFLNVQTGIAQKLPNQLFSGLVHSKGF